MKAKTKIIKELEEKARRLENSVSSQASPSSQEWVSPQRFDHYMKLANECREEAKKLKNK